MLAQTTANMCSATRDFVRAQPQGSALCDAYSHICIALCCVLYLCNVSASAAMQNPCVPGPGALHCGTSCVLCAMFTRAQGHTHRALRCDSHICIALCCALYLCNVSASAAMQNPCVPGHGALHCGTSCVLHVCNVDWSPGPHTQGSALRDAYSHICIALCCALYLCNVSASAAMQNPCVPGHGALHCGTT